MYIEIPYNKLYPKGIVIDPRTFEPCVKLIIDKSYYESIEKNYYIKKISEDRSKLIDYINNYHVEINPIEMRYEIGSQPETSEETTEFKSASKVLNSMYHNVDYRIPVVLDVIPYSEITISEVTRILAKRYKDILQDKRYIDSHLDKTSNENLYWMCNRIIEDDSLPDDKISRWIGFIQGVMSTKGYITVDEERDFSRPLFHHAYSAKSIPIPETREMK